MDAITFQAEVKRMEKMMFRVSYAYLGNQQDAEDAMQDTLVKTWEKRQSLRDVSQFQPWAMRILVNRCKDMLRRRKKISFTELNENAGWVDLQEEISPVMEAVQQLKPEERLVIVLHYVDGLSVKEMAAALQMNINTVKTRMYTARKRLSHTLLVEWEEEK